MPSPLALAQIEGQRRLRLAAKRGVTNIWNALPNHDRASIDQWLSKVLPLVESAQRASVNLTQAYLARSLETQPAAIDPALLIGAAARNGTKPEEVYMRPFVTLWSELKEGKLWDEAAAMGLARATGSAATDVQLSMRETLSAVQEAEPRIYGWERNTDGAACSFCQELDGAYTFEEPGPIHSGCGCSATPLESPHPGAVKLPDGTVIRDFQYGPLKPQPLPAGVAVHRHGELGAVLGGAGQNFMDKAAALAR